MNLNTLPNPNLAHGIVHYVEHRIAPGSFLRALLCNDLAMAAIKADDVNRNLLPELVMWMFRELPSECWGSDEAYSAWIACQQERAA